MPALLTVLLIASAIGGCGGNHTRGETAPIAPAFPSETGSADADRLAIPGAGEALVWGRGCDAALLAHGAAFDAASWGPQARRIAAQGNLVVALEAIGPEEIGAAIEYLRAERSATSVVLIGASAGADAALQALAGPGAVDQLITLSVNSTSSPEDLGPQPKLFIASEEESVAGLSTQLAQTSLGEDNEALLLPGSAHAQAIFDGPQGDRALRAILDQIGAPA
ncbi:MAG: hypothetical protein WBB30_08415 [Solirubrobacterales bacterium]